MKEKKHPAPIARREFRTIDEYINSFPPGIREILEQLRTTIHENAPGAQETITYGIPTFTLHGNLVHFGAYEQHIGFYPTPPVIQAFEDELAPYHHAKGSVRFPLDKPIPFDLVRRMVRFRVEEHLTTGKSKE